MLIKVSEFCVVRFAGCWCVGRTIDAFGLFKSDTRDTCLDVQTNDGDVRLSTHQGLAVKQLDRGAVIFKLERKEGVCCADHRQYQPDAGCWIDDSRHVRDWQDSCHNTHNALDMCKKYVAEHFAREYDVSKADQAELLNDTIRCF